MRKPHILPKNERKTCPSRIIFFDSEAHVNPNITDEDIERLEHAERVEKPHDPYLIIANFVHIYVAKNRYTEKYLEFYGENFLERFWDFVDSCAQWGKKLYLFAHNAKYDTQVCQAVPHLVRRGYQCVGFSDSNPFILKFSQERETGRFTKDGKPIRQHKQIIILSSTNYYQSSLADLGKTFGIQKLDYDHSEKDFSMQKAIIYCRRDVEILTKAMMEFLAFIQRDDLGNFSLTIAGQAFAAFRHRFMENDIYIHSEKKALEVERRAYAGGRTEAWHIGEVPEPVIYGNDFNSMYPSVMIENRFPTKLVRFRRRPGVGYVKAVLRDGFLVCCDCLVKTKIPIFHKKEDKLFFPIGTFWTTLSTPEILEGLRRGLIKDVKNVCVYEGDFIFRSYVQYFYRQRLKAKAKGDKVLDHLYKIFLNSLYGKFGQKNDVWKKVGDCDPDDVRVERIVTTSGSVTFKRIGGSEFRKNDEEYSEAFHSFPAIAAHVTAYARMKLWKCIEAVGLHNVYYMDTDSLFTNVEGYHLLEQAGLADDKELGKMKLEKKITHFFIYGCKDYQYFDLEKEEWKIKIKGVTKSAKKISPDNQGHERFVVMEWPGFSQALRDRDLMHYANRLKIKTLYREYDKGEVGKNGRVKPYKLKEDKDHA